MVTFSYFASGIDRGQIFGRGRAGFGISRPRPRPVLQTWLDLAEAEAEFGKKRPVLAETLV